MSMAEREVSARKKDEQRGRDRAHHASSEGPSSEELGEERHFGSCTKKRSSERSKGKSETRAALETRRFASSSSTCIAPRILGSLHMATQQTPDFQAGVEYWANTDASVNGVLGGFGQ